MTSVVFRNTDLTRWGVGKGANMTADDYDNSIWYLYSNLRALIDHPQLGTGIDYISQAANTFTIHLTDHTTQGPFIIPTSTFKDRGAWAPTVAYLVNDLFTYDGSIYYVLFAHTSAATFDPGANDGMGHNYYQLLLTAPTDVLPLGGSPGQVLAKIDGHDLNVAWYTIGEVPVGGTSGQALVKHSSTNFDTLWETLHTIPAGGSLGWVLTKTATADFDYTWEPAPAGSLGTSSDVTLSTPTNGQVLTYDSTSGTWKNATAGAGSFTISGAADATPGMASPAIGQYPEWNGAKWQNTGLAISNAVDAKFTPPLNTFDIMRYDTSAGGWINFNRSAIEILGTSGALFPVMAMHAVSSLTPTADCNVFGGPGAPIGERWTLKVTTSGTTTFNITFDGASMISQGTLVTGVVSGKTYAVTFVFDGTVWTETGRTLAM